LKERKERERERERGIEFFAILKASSDTFLCGTGLPDGLFSNQKSQFGQFLECLRWENVYIFYGQLEYFMDIWDIL
jgi:hypothetical protein